MKGVYLVNMKSAKIALLFAMTCAVLITSACAPAADAPAPSEALPTPLAQEQPAPPEPAPTSAPTPSPAPLFDRDGIAEPGTTPPPSGEDSGSMEDYKEKNKDVVGWIKVPNTPIDYPVVMGGDNNFYLDHDVDRKKNKHGAIFMDCTNKQDSRKRHLILYGHRMNNGSMFGSLNKYEKEDFFKKNDEITFTFGGKKATWKVFSAHRYDITKDNFTQTDFGSDADFEDYMEGFKEKSKFKSDVSVDGGDQVLTLLTCTKGYGDNERFVVHFKKVT